MKNSKKTASKKTAGKSDREGIQRKKIAKDTKPPRKTVMKSANLKQCAIFSPKLESRVQIMGEPSMRAQEMQWTTFKMSTPFADGPLLENIAKCKYFLESKCSYGDHCRLSHNFYDEQAQRHLDLAKKAIKGNSYGCVHLRTFNFSLFTSSKPEQIYLATSSPSGRSNRIYAATRQDKVSYLFSFQQLCNRPIVRKPIPGEVIGLLDLGSQVLITERPYQSQVLLLTSKMACIYTTTTLKPIYKKMLSLFNDSVLIRQTQLGIRMKSREVLRDAIFVLGASGYFTALSFPKLEVLININLGFTILDYDIFTLKNQEVKSQAVSLWKNDTVAIGGKGIQLLDLNLLKITKKFSYNRYAYYTAVKVVELGAGEQTLIVALGRLNDKMIEFSNSLFLEIWNPVSLGMLKRIPDLDLTISTVTLACCQLEPLYSSGSRNCSEFILRTPNVSKVVNIFEAKTADIATEGSSVGLSLQRATQAGGAYVTLSAIQHTESRHFIIHYLQLAR